MSEKELKKLIDYMAEAISSLPCSMREFIGEDAWKLYCKLKGYEDEE